MAYSTNPDDGVRIYHQEEGAGSPLAMINGWTANAEMWRDSGFVDELADHHQLVMIEPRGHGRSGKPHDPDAYARATDVRDVLAVLDDLGIDRAHVLGYSMGGGIAFNVGRRAPERVRSLIIGGAGPLRPSELFLWLVSTGAEGTLELFDDAMRASGGELSESTRSLLAGNDVDALLGRYLSQGFVPDDVLAAMLVPALFFAGTEDPLHALAERAAGQMPNASLVLLEGMDHIQASMPPATELVMPRIKEFLTKVDSEVASAT